ncbi:MAG: hypothetical protein RIQ89_836 [Bacteroidota bacterium]|jgi:hypothetical protein
MLKRLVLFSLILQYAFANNGFAMVYSICSHTGIVNAACCDKPDKSDQNNKSCCDDEPLAEEENCCNEVIQYSKLNAAALTEDFNFTIAPTCSVALATIYQFYFGEQKAGTAFYRISFQTNTLPGVYSVLRI